MIVFNLKCSQGHTFEGWFDDGQAYDAQKEQGLLTCPVCNDNAIDKAPSTFAIKASSGTKPQVPPAEELAAIGKKICDYVERNFDDVGTDFAKEALKMHFGAAEQRNIRGKSTKEEEEMLQEEGVPFFKMPVADSSET